MLLAVNLALRYGRVDRAKEAVVTAALHERRVELKELVRARALVADSPPAREPDEQLADSALRHRHAR